MNFKGKAIPLQDIDLPQIGATIGVGEDEIHAVLDAETNGKGFDGRGRPKMLFEPHIFYRELGKGQKRDRAVKLGLARPRWKRDYPKDSYARLEAAMKIDEAAALRSASWGLGQVMGFNHKLAGFDTVQEMVEAFKESEGKQLFGMITFIKNAGLADALRRHDWKAFARGYNGKGFAQNGYDKKLAASYAKWSKIKDTPFPVYNNSMPLGETAPKAHPYPQDDAPPLPDPVAISETLKPRGTSPQIPPTARPDQPARPVLSPAGATKRGGLIALFVAGIAGIAAWTAGLLCNVPWLAEFLGVGCGG